MRSAVASTEEVLGSRLRMLVGKPGLDGHSNGAEQIVAAAVEEDVDVVGLSILSGSHLELVPLVLDGLRAAGLDDVPVVVGGIIPDDDADTLHGLGVAAVFTPKDYDATAIMARVLDEVRVANGLPRLAVEPS